MSSIGPQLPPHLAKRKRSVSDDEGEAGSPPSKVHAIGPQQPPSNKDEITLDDDDDSSGDDDDAYGPSIPRTAAAQQQNSQPSSIGPTLPASIGPTMPTASAAAAAPSIGPAAPPPSIGPSTGPTNTDEIDLADSDDDDQTHGPAPPLSAPQQQPKRIHGPAPPPGPLSERPPHPPSASDSEEDSEDDDDDYGPALPTSSAHQARQSQAEAAAAAHSARESAQSKAPQRDDWMLAPPTGDEHRPQDPTKIRARKFNSGPRASAGAGGDKSAGGAGISSIWTETPEQKRKRLEDAVLGRGGSSNRSSGSAAAQAQQPGGGGARTREEEERAERIRNNIQKARGPSLLEAHQRGDGKGNSRVVEEEEDDPSKRAFDREKDMKLGGRIGTAQRNELLKRSANFGDRFSKGKYL